VAEAQDHAAVRFFPPGLPLLTVLIGLGLQYLWPLRFGIEPPAPARYWIGGIVLVAPILFLGLWTFLIFRGIGQSPNPWKPTPSIVSHGPFRITRNPMYLQMVLACIGVAILLSNWWILFLTPICVWLLQSLAVIPEEAYLLCL